MRRDARALPWFASILSTLALMNTPKAACGAGRVLRTGFVTAAERNGTERSHASYTTSTTCNLHSFLDYVFVLTLDTGLKETCRSECNAEEKRKPGHAKPGRSKPVQLQAKSLKPSHSKPGHWLGLG